MTKLLLINEILLVLFEKVRFFSGSGDNSAFEYSPFFFIFHEFNRLIALNF